MANKSRETANLVSSKTGIAVTISGDPVVLGVGNTQLVTVFGNGNIGINTTSPTSPAQIQIGAGGTTTVYIGDNGAIGIGLTTYLNNNAWGLTLQGDKRIYTERGLIQTQYLQLGSAGDPYSGWAVFGSTSNSFPILICRNGDTNNKDIFIDTNAKVGFGTTQMSAAHEMFTTNPEVFTSYCDGDTGEWTCSSSRNSAGTSVMNLQFSRGTVKEPSSCNDGDVIGRIDFKGYSVSTYQGTARIQSVATQAFSGGASSDLQFYTTAHGQTTPTKRVDILQNGTVAIGNTLVPGTYVGNADKSVGYSLGVAQFLEKKQFSSGWHAQFTDAYDDGAKGRGGAIVFGAFRGNGGQFNAAAIGGAKSNNTIGNENGDCVLYASVGSGLTERIRATSSGEIGINEDAPSRMLHITSNTPYIRLEDKDSSTGVTAQGGLEMYDSDGDRIWFLALDSASTAHLTLQNSTSGDIHLLTSGTYGDGGYVGIATNVPTAKLHVHTNNLNQALKVTSRNDWGNITDFMVEFDGDSRSGGDGNVLRVKGGASRTDAEIFDVDNRNGNKFRVRGDGAVIVAGNLSKGSGSFTIDHPLEHLSRTHNLVHSFVEGPRADLIYRGEVRLVAGIATIIMDESVGLTTGTWQLLCRDPDVFVTNNEDWTPVKAGITSTGVLTIQAQDNTCTSKVNWLVIAERHDKHMYDTGWTDENGKPILEPRKREKDIVGIAST